MQQYRFRVGTTILCNLGELGWRPGRIIALNYRESNWPEGEFAPYQVALKEDYSLIYVPEDSDRYCCETAPEDRRILRRKDALAGSTPFPPQQRKRLVLESTLIQNLPEHNA